MTDQELRLVAEIIDRMHLNAAERQVEAVGRVRADSVTLSASYEQRIEALTKALQHERDANRRMSDEVIFQTNSHGKTMVERDGLLTQVQDLRAALEKEQELHAATALRMATDAAKMVERKPGAWIKTNDGRVLSVRGYLVRLSPDREELYDGGVCTPCEPPDQAERKHPVKVGEYVKRMTGFNTTPAGEIGRVTLIDDDNADDIEYEVKRPNGERGVWSARNCTPCDPPTAAHDTPEGRSVAESVIRNDRKTEPADDVKEGDVVEVVSATHRLYTEHEDLGCRGVVTVIDGMRLLLGEVPGYKLPIRGIVGKCDVRKVTT